MVARQRTRGLLLGIVLGVMLLTFALIAAGPLAIAPKFLVGSGWAGFKTNFDNFFRNGLGGDGAKAIGGAVLAIGIVCAVVSFALHKFNPQTRFPGWVMCLVIGFAGFTVTNGIEVYITLFGKVEDLIKGWIGIT